MKEIYLELEKIVPSQNIKYDEPMKLHTTTKVGGNVECFIEPSNVNEIRNIINFAKENGIPYYVIGHGSNLLVVDEGLEGIVIKIGSLFSNVEIEGTVIKANAGCAIPRLSQMAKNNSLSGLEFACGIPGTVGGAIRMNAGAYGGEMVNIVDKVGYLNEKGEIVEISNDECGFSYRHSMFVEHPEYVILYAVLKMSEGNKEEIEAKMNENMESRKAKQPIEYPNFGSVFKRPTQEGVFVGKMVEELGLKGYQIGGAQVSTKHSGFIINAGEATCKDVIDLIEYVKNKVYEKYGVMLQEEVVILGGK